MHAIYIITAIIYNAIYNKNNFFSKNCYKKYSNENIYFQQTLMTLIITTITICRLSLAGYATIIA